MSCFFDFGSFGYLRCGLFYCFGEWIGCNFPEVVKKNYNRKLAPFVYLLLSTILATCAPSLVSSYTYVPIRISQCVAIWLLADCVAIEKKPKWWMTTAFFIYCIHSPVLESFERLFLIIIGKNITGAWLSFLLAPLVTVLTILIIAKMMRKWRTAWDFVTGNR